MKYLKQQITDFTSSTLTDTYSDWDSATTYVLEEDTSLTDASVVKYGTYYYRSLTNDNTKFNPVEYENIKWVKWGVSNKYAMIDLESLTKSESNSDIVVEFARGTADTIAFGYFKTSEIIIEHLDVGGVVIPANTQHILYGVSDEVYDYYDYIYSPYTSLVDRALKVNIAPVGVTIRVTLKVNVTDSVANIGYLVAGEALSMGETLFGAKFSFNSYALKETDAFGTLSITKRNVQELVDFETNIESINLSRLKREIKGIYNDIVVFILDESEASNYENLLTLGTIENSEVLLQNPVNSTISWSILESI